MTVSLKSTSASTVYLDRLRIDGEVLTFDIHGEGEPWREESRTADPHEPDEWRFWDVAGHQISASPDTLTWGWDSMPERVREP